MLTTIEVTANVSYLYFSYAKLYIGNEEGNVVLVDALEMKNSLKLRDKITIVVIPPIGAPYTTDTLVEGKQ